MTRMLFVCIENSNRSQMAQAFALIHGKGKVEAFSAGSNPSGKLNEKAIASMKELDYDLTVHASKSIEQYRGHSFDFVVTMGCGDACPFIPAKNRVDWDIPDPRNMDPDQFRVVRDLIRAKVINLIEG